MGVDDGGALGLVCLYGSAVPYELFMSLPNHEQYDMLKRLAGRKGSVVVSKHEHWDERTRQIAGTSIVVLILIVLFLLKKLFPIWGL